MSKTKHEKNDLIPFFMGRVAIPGVGEFPCRIVMPIVKQSKPVSHLTGYKVSSNPEYYLSLIAKLWGVDENNTINMLKGVSLVSPGALLNLLLMVVAKEFDKGYDNHISETSEVFAYSTTDSKIFSIPTNQLRKVSFKYFAAFRTRQQAILGINIVNSIRNLIFTNGRE